MAGADKDGNPVDSEGRRTSNTGGQPRGVGQPCRGIPGTCIDHTQQGCATSDLRPGKCGGGGNVVCCAAQGAPPAPTAAGAGVPCGGGVDGQCVNLKGQFCPAARRVSGKCGGGSSVVCCRPDPAAEARNAAIRDASTNSTGALGALAKGAIAAKVLKDTVGNTARAARAVAAAEGAVASSAKNVARLTKELSKEMAAAVRDPAKIAKLTEELAAAKTTAARASERLVAAKAIEANVAKGGGFIANNRALAALKDADSLAAKAATATEKASKLRLLAETHPTPANLKNALNAERAALKLGDDAAGAMARANSLVRSGADDAARGLMGGIRAARAASADGKLVATAASAGRELAEATSASVRAAERVTELTASLKAAQAGGDPKLVQSLQKSLGEATTAAEAASARAASAATAKTAAEARLATAVGGDMGRAATALGTEATEAGALAKRAQARVTRLERLVASTKSAAPGTKAANALPGLESRLAEARTVLQNAEARALSTSLAADGAAARLTTAQNALESVKGGVATTRAATHEAATRLLSAKAELTAAENAARDLAAATKAARGGSVIAVGDEAARAAARVTEARNAVEAATATLAKAGSAEATALREVATATGSHKKIINAAGKASDAAFAAANAELAAKSAVTEARAVQAARAGNSGWNPIKHFQEWRANRAVASAVAAEGRAAAAVAGASAEANVMERVAQQGVGNSAQAAREIAAAQASGRAAAATAAEANAAKALQAVKSAPKGGNILTRGWNALGEWRAGRQASAAAASAREAAAASQAAANVAAGGSAKVNKKVAEAVVKAGKLEASAAAWSTKATALREVGSGPMQWLRNIRASRLESKAAAAVVEAKAATASANVLKKAAVLPNQPGFFERRALNKAAAAASKEVMATARVAEHAEKAKNAGNFVTKAYHNWRARQNGLTAAKAGYTATSKAATVVGNLEARGATTAAQREATKQLAKQTALKAEAKMLADRAAILRERPLHQVRLLDRFKAWRSTKAAASAEKAAAAAGSRATALQTGQARAGVIGRTADRLRGAATSAGKAVSNVGSAAARMVPESVRTAATRLGKVAAKPFQAVAKPFTSAGRASIAAGIKTLPGASKVGAVLGSPAARAAGRLGMRALPVVAAVSALHSAAEGTRHATNCWDDAKRTGKANRECGNAALAFTTDLVLGHGGTRQVAELAGKGIRATREAAKNCANAGVIGCTGKVLAGTGELAVKGVIGAGALAVKGVGAVASGSVDAAKCILASDDCVTRNAKKAWDATSNGVKGVWNWGAGLVKHHTDRVERNRKEEAECVRTKGKDFCDKKNSEEWANIRKAAAGVASDTVSGAWNGIKSIGF